MNASNGGTWMNCLFGDRISAGMEKEILLAKEMNSPIISKTEGTKRNLERLVFLKKYRRIGLRICLYDRKTR